ncbi:MAG: hypothetical protein M0R28_18355 [Pigmentiphaga sp.]|nr:hypothetical protein [Pigmentiphaga sp.]
MKKPPLFRSPLNARWVAAPLSLALLAACGGSDDDGPPPQPIVKHVVNGQVAVGALVSGATVTITCANGGSGSAVQSGSNGSFEITLSEGSTLPCVGEAVLPGTNNVMRSVIPGGTPAITRINFSPLTDAYVSYLLGGTNKGETVDPKTLITGSSNLFTMLVNSRQAFNSAKAGFEAYITGNTGISLSGFDFLSSNIVVGQPSDNALESLATVQVHSDPNDPLSPLVPFLNPDGSVSAAGRATTNFDAPVVTQADIPPCSAPGNSCGGEAGREVVITGGSGT